MRRFLMWALLALPGALLAARRSTSRPPHPRRRPDPAAAAATGELLRHPALRRLPWHPLLAEPVRRPDYHLRMDYVGEETPKAADDIAGGWSRTTAGACCFAATGPGAELPAEGREPPAQARRRGPGDRVHPQLRPGARAAVRRVRASPTGSRDVSPPRGRGAAAGVRHRRRYAVPARGDNLALEQAYLKARREPGEELLINAEVRIIVQPRMDAPARKRRW